MNKLLIIFLTLFISSSSYVMTRQFVTSLAEEKCYGPAYPDTPLCQDYHDY
jgi:hypothetical protein